MSYESVTKRHLEALKLKIQEAIATKGLDNSGEAFDSLSVQGNQLLGNDYIYFLDQGRKPGKFPPTLIEWVKNKLGLEGAEAKQVDFLIRRKISREGTTIFNDKSKGIQLEQLIEEMLEELYKDIDNETKVEVMKWL